MSGFLGRMSQGSQGSQGSENGSDSEDDNEDEVVHYERFEQSQDTRNRLLSQLAATTTSGRQSSGGGGLAWRQRPPAVAAAPRFAPKAAHRGFLEDDEDDDDDDDDGFEAQGQARPMQTDDSIFAQPPARQARRRQPKAASGVRASHPLPRARINAASSGQLTGGIDLVGAFLSTPAGQTGSEAGRSSSFGQQQFGQHSKRTGRATKVQPKQRMHSIRLGGGGGGGGGGSGRSFTRQTQHIGRQPGQQNRLDGGGDGGQQLSQLSQVQASQSGGGGGGGFSIGSIDLSLFGVDPNAAPSPPRQQQQRAQQKTQSSWRASPQHKSPKQQAPRVHSISEIPRALPMSGGGGGSQGSAAGGGGGGGQAVGGSATLSRLIPADQKATQLP